jgi:outer membrane protein TolC
MECCNDKKIDCINFGRIAVLTTAHAETLPQILPGLLKSDNLIKASQHDMMASKEGIKEAIAGWLPQATITAFAGRQKRNMPTSSNNTTLSTIVDP